MTEDVGPDDHDCRTRVRDGHAERVAVWREANIQLKYECDVCGRAVYLICEAYNIQISLEDDGILEPGLEADRVEIWDADLQHRP